MENKVRMIREERGLSQTRLACIVGLPGSALSDIELGKRQPWPKARKALSEALKVSETELFPENGSGKVSG